MTDRLLRASFGDQREPCGGVRTVARAEHDHAEIGDGEQCSAYGVRVGERREYIRAFDREVCDRASAELAELAPQSSVVERRAQIGQRLPLDDGSSPERVVTDRDAAHGYLEPDVPERDDHPFRLVNVHVDLHEPRVPPDLLADRRKTAMFAPLAISPARA